MTTNAKISLWITAAASIAALTTAIVAVLSLNSTLRDTAKKDAEDDKLAWQFVIVNDAIAPLTTKPIRGASFEDIKQAYMNAAQIVKDVEIDKNDLQDIVLKRLLLSLQNSARIYYAEDGLYYTNRAIVNPTLFDTPIVAKLTYDLSVILAAEGGKYTVDSLYMRVAKDIPELRPDVYHTTLDELIAYRKILVTDNKVWSASEPPPNQQPVEAPSAAPLPTK